MLFFLGAICGMFIFMFGMIVGSAMIQVKQQNNNQNGDPFANPPKGY